MDVPTMLLFINRINLLESHSTMSFKFEHPFKVLKTVELMINRNWFKVCWVMPGSACSIFNQEYKISGNNVSR